MKYIFDKYSLLDILLPFLFLICAFVATFLHYQTHRPIWKNYNVLVLPFESDIDKITDTMEEMGIKGIINSKSVKVRFKDEEELTPFTLKELYVKWFENENDGLSYIYIPKTSYIPLSFLNFLKKKGISFYLEGERHISFINLISAIFLIFLFLIFSTRRILFFFVNLPFAMLSFLIRGQLMFASCMLFILSTLYIIEIVYASPSLNKKERKSRIRANIPFLALFCFALILTFFDTYLSYIYVFLAIISSLSIGYVIEKFRYLSEKEKDEGRLHEKLEIYTMSPTSFTRIFSKKKVTCLIVIFIFCYLPHVLFNIFCLSPLPDSNENMLSLPCPSSINRYSSFDVFSFESCYERKSGDALPDLTDYISDKWVDKTFMYTPSTQSIQMPKNGEKIVFTDYYEEKDGKIKEMDVYTFVFNNEFIFSVLENVEENSIEALLKSEGGFLSVFYNFKFFYLSSYDFLTVGISVLFIFLSLAIMLFKVVRTV